MPFIYNSPLQNSTLTDSLTPSCCTCQLARVCSLCISQPSCCKRDQQLFYFRWLECSCTISASADVIQSSGTSATVSYSSVFVGTQGNAKRCWSVQAGETNIHTCIQLHFLAWRKCKFCSTIAWWGVWYFFILQLHVPKLEWLCEKKGKFLVVVHFEDLAEDDDLGGQVLILEVNNSLFFFLLYLLNWTGDSSTVVCPWWKSLRNSGMMHERG